MEVIVLFGEKLKETRRRKGLTQKQLADLIGVKDNSISNWEKDRNLPKNMDTIILLCETLDIDINWLLYDGKEPPKNVAVLKYLTDDSVNELPQEAKNEIDNFIEFIKSKYNPRRN